MRSSVHIRRMSSRRLVGKLPVLLHEVKLIPRPKPTSPPTWPPSPSYCRSTGSQTGGVLLCLGPGRIAITRTGFVVVRSGITFIILVDLCKQRNSVTHFNGHFGLLTRVPKLCRFVPNPVVYRSKWLPPVDRRLGLSSGSRGAGSGLAQRLKVPFRKRFQFITPTDLGWSPKYPMLPNHSDRST